ncbi:MAG TPA: phage holin family protein [Candidatus Binatia bacterium]|nr:phage holin family protein [Candidatus Binatia bacterium]
MAFLLNWVLSALSLLVVGRLIPGFQVQGFGTALLAALVLGFLNATLGAVLAVLTLPLTLLTFGLFDFVVMAFIIWIVTAVVPGFHVTGFFAAFFGAIVLAIVSTLLRHLVAA